MPKVFCLRYKYRIFVAMKKGQTSRFRIDAYPSGWLKKMIIAYCKDFEVSESRAVCDICSEYFKNLPSEKRSRLENMFKN